MKIRSVKQIKNLHGKRVLVRVDYNLPFKDGKLDFKENMRIKLSLLTLKYLLKKGATVILMAHLGRPKAWSGKLSLAPIAKHLGKLMKRKVNFVDGNILEEDISKKIKGGLNFLENVRFYEEEKKDDKKFARCLSKFADIYVNEAFSVSHRAQSSVSSIQNFLPSYAGLHLEEEVRNLSRVLGKNIEKKNHPFIAIMGGAKISTKLKLINRLLSSADQVLLGGALISNILKYRGYSIGTTFIEKMPERIVKKINSSKKIILPVDIIVGKKDDPDSAKAVNLNNRKKLCEKNQGILDIGPQTITLFSQYVKKAKTIIWNGPMGYFENSSFAYGTLTLARLVAMRGKGHAYAIIGGGETAVALNKTGMARYVDWVSTGGGAMLAYLGGEKLPGFKKIIR